MKTIAQFLKVLADETRLQMLWLLCKHRELCVCDLMKVLGITQSKASRHLAALRHAGLVVDRREATWVHYSLTAPAGGVEGAVLDALFVGLTDHPAAVKALQDLEVWLESADRKTTCAGSVQRRAPVSDR